MNIIRDDFTSLKVSRQRRYQLRRLARGLCQQCGKRPLVTLAYCQECCAKNTRCVRRLRARRGAR
jgi:hypothetical protein